MNKAITRSLFAAILLVGLSLQAAAKKGLSAKRALGTSYKLHMQSVGPNPDGPSANEKAGLYSKLDFEKLPEFADRAALDQAFKDFRDLRFLADPLIQGPMTDANARRTSWMYPDDGCFVRAHLQNWKVFEKTGVRMKKVFIFGDLEVATKNHPDGKVGWWYHVVDIARDGLEPIVFDQAVNPKEPMTLRAWAEAMSPKGSLDDPKEGESQNASTTLSICSAGTYDPGSKCETQVFSESEAMEDQPDYLISEEERLKELPGRDAQKELHEAPLWLI